MNGIYDNAAIKALSLLRTSLSNLGQELVHKKHYAAVDELENIVKKTCTSTRRERFDTLS